MLGRRGPAQAAFTNPELRELGELARADVIVEPAEVQLDDESAAWLESDDANATARRNVALLSDYAQRPVQSKSHRIVLRFLRSPVEIVDDEHGAVTALRVARNRVERSRDGTLRAVATGEHETIDCGLVIRSIGYRGGALDGIPFDERRGIIRNDRGRVCGEDGQRWRASTRSAGSSAGRAASSARTRRTRPTRLLGSWRTATPRGSTSRRTPIRTPSRRTWRRSRPGSSPGRVGPRSTHTSARLATPAGARA